MTYFRHEDFCEAVRDGNCRCRVSIVARLERQARGRERRQITQAIVSYVEQEAADYIRELETALQWVNRCVPRTLKDGGAQIDMTWSEFNRMREAVGLAAINVRPK